MFVRTLVPITVCAFAFLSPFLPASVRAQEEAGKNVEKQFAVELDPEKFNQALQTGNVFVKFFAPWCGHCKRLHPLWEQLAEIMNVEDPKVIIAKVDCTKHQALCAEHEVTGYPTLRLFKLGETESVKFKGTRDLPAITDFINHELSTPAEVEQGEATKEQSGGGTVPVANQHVGKVVDLTEDTFAKHVSSGNHFVKFFAPWCSHCQRLAPTWDELAKELKEHSGVTVSKIDCTQYRSVCQDFEVKGYPTLLWIEDGKKIEKYSGARDLPTLKTYVEKMVGVPADKKEASSDTAAQEAAKEKADEEAEKLKPQQLTGEGAFTEAVAEGTAFIKFYAPWCGHCQKLQPTWEQLATETHNAQSGIVIAKVDCTAPENKQICIDEQVEGYPTLFLYKNGQRQDEYEGSRTLPELKAYLKKTIGHDEL